MDKPPYECFEDKEDIVTSILDEWKPRTPLQEVWWWIQYGIWNWVGYRGEIWRYVVRFWQRGIRGYANCDVWGLHYYLSDVIYGSVKSLREHLNGHPCDMTLKQWERALDSIIWTFDVARKMYEDNWWYLEPDNRTEKEMKKLKETAKRMEKSHQKCELLKGEKYHVMTFAECEKYEKGWKLFTKHFFDLWD